MNIKKSFLPIAILTASALGGTAFINPQNYQNKNKTKIAGQNIRQLDDKKVFDYMKYTSSPVKENNNGLNLVAGLFGLGLAGAKRKEDVMTALNELEEFAYKSKVNDNKSVYEQLLSSCKTIRRYINKENLTQDDIELVKTTVKNMQEYVRQNIRNEGFEWTRPYMNTQIITAIIVDGNYSKDSQEYRKECLTILDDIINGITEISTKHSYYDSLTTKANIKKLRDLVEKGESDFPGLRAQVLNLLDSQETSLNFFKTTTTEQLVYDMYRRIPRMNWFISKFVSSKEDWDNNKFSVKFRFPDLEKFGEHDVYKMFRTKTLANCKRLRTELDLCDTCHVLPLVDEIKADMINFGTYDESAFANAMMMCDRLLTKYASGHYKGSFQDLLSDLEMLTENVYTSVKRPESLGQPNPSPKSFDDWQASNKTNSQDSRKLVDPVKYRQTETEEINNEPSSFDEKPGVQNDGKITFSSVGGQDKAIEQLKKKVLYPVKYPKAFQNRMLSHGIIMYGRPGTGKTLIALALSNEADAHFIKINASQLTSSLHGETDKNWRELFEKAREQQPCIIFIDEFDTVAQSRGHNATNNYDDTVINTILTEMSDIEKNGDNIFVIGATNRFEVLDAGMLRAGRFGTHIELKAPETVKDVLQIFDIHTRDKVLADDVDKEQIAKLMLNKNVTGSDIASMVNEALENTFLRLGIYEKMENETFSDNDLGAIKTNMDDFINAIDNYDVVIDKKSEKRPIIGFNKK